jgi:hypothetical protein
MIKKCFNYLLCFILFLAAFSFKATAQNIQAEAKLQQYTIKIGEQTKLFLSVNQPAKEHVNFPKLVDTITGKLIVVSTGKPDTSADQNDKNSITVIQNYTITSFDAGTYTIPSFSIGSSKDVIKTNELTLQVVSVKVDTTKAIYDIKQPLAVSYTFLDWLKDNWYWVVAGLVVLVIVGGLIWYFKNKPKVEIVVEEIKPNVPAHVIALNKLKELRDKKLWQQDEIKQYYIELSDVLREYLEKRYEVKTHEKTTDEIFDGLKRKSITNENRNKLKQLLVLSDLVKFAKERPLPRENDESMENAMGFVVNTQQAEVKEKPQEGSANV